MVNTFVKRPNSFLTIRISAEPNDDAYSIRLDSKSQNLYAIPGIMRGNSLKSPVPMAKQENLNNEINTISIDVH